MPYNLEKSNFYIDWLEQSIAEESLILYEYSDFINLQSIGNGSFGNVRNEEEIDLSIKGKSSLKSTKEIDEDLEYLELSEDINFCSNINESYSSLSKKSFQSNLSNITDFKNKSNRKSSKKSVADLKKIEDIDFYYNANINNLSEDSVDSIFINHITVD
ncbi:4549_t:CDS:2, partial [Funneliformis mosseae]